MNKQKVYLEFINKKGVKKKVMFYMDKQSYEMICDKSISDAERNKYLADEYHEYERERYYKRKFVSFDVEMAEALELIEDESLSYAEKIEIKFKNKELYEAINKLTPRQQEIVRLIYWEGKTQKELTEIYGIKKQSICDAVGRIHTTLRRLLRK